MIRKEFLKIEKGHHFAVYPKLVYIANPTEYGSAYSKSELEEIYKTSKELGLYLYMDGARLANTLAVEDFELKFDDLTKLCDAFYIGSTKNGGLLGEALVIKNNELKPFFKWSQKQRGALLAKTRAMSAGFYELLKGDLYIELGKHANRMSDILREGVKEAGYQLFVESKTNQTFVIFPEEIAEKLLKDYALTLYNTLENGDKIIRFVTSWITKEEDVLELNKYLLELK
jgi:threonine aldolase